VAEDAEVFDGDGIHFRTEGRYGAGRVGDSLNFSRGMVGVRLWS
jgi:hypothetical protein